MKRLYSRLPCLMFLFSLSTFPACNRGGSSDAIKPANQPETAPPEVAPAAQADLPPDWGSLKGRITLSGAPVPEKIVITRDEEFCGKFNLVDESIQVNKLGGGLANVLVWLYTARDEDPPPPHESYAAAAADEIYFDNFQCRFTPRIVAMRTTQTLVIKNSDRVPHTAFIPYDPAPINPTLATGATQRKQFPEPTRVPLLVTCSIHAWMQARILALDTPYMAVTDENGEFEIALLPPGEWTFQFYHEKFGYLNQVEFQDQRARWEKGRPQFTIAGGNLTDLGEVKLKYGDYEESP